MSSPRCRVQIHKRTMGSLRGEIIHRKIIHTTCFLLSLVLGIAFGICPFFTILLWLITSTSPSPSTPRSFQFAHPSSGNLSLSSQYTLHTSLHAAIIRSHERTPHTSLRIVSSLRPLPAGLLQSLDLGVRCIRTPVYCSDVHKTSMWTTHCHVFESEEIGYDNAAQCCSS
jgi:hypothetical protein